MKAAAKLRSVPWLSRAPAGSGWWTCAVGRVGQALAVVPLAAWLVLAWPAAGVAQAATKTPVVLAVWAHVGADVPVAGALMYVRKLAPDESYWWSS